MLKKTAKHMKRYGQLYILILPTIVFLIIFDYIPMYGNIMAFQNFKPKLGYFGSEWVGFKHFVRFLNYPGFWKLMKNTVRISVYGFLTFPLPIVLALFLNELRSEKFKKIVQMITYAPHFLSVVVVCGIITLVTERSGPLGLLYQAITGNSTNLLTMPEYFDSIFVWSDVWQSIGWGSIIYVATLAGINGELIEAAKLDGASRLQVIWYINIPSILPTIITMFILRVGSIFGVGFSKIYLLQNDLNLEASRVISTYVYEIGLIGGQFSYSAAIGLFNTAINITLLIITNTVIKKINGSGL